MDAADVVLAVRDEMFDVAEATDPAACVLRPERFFVAWNGVMTLAFQGFPPGLCAVKEWLGDLCLSAENFGSRWPKATLGALREGVELSDAEIAALDAVCRLFGERLAASGWRFRPPAVSLVFMQCRSLEKFTMRAEFPLGGGAGGGGGGGGDGVPADEQQRGVVRGVLAEADDLAAYSARVRQPGFREPHYRAPHAEGTVVCFLGGFLGGDAGVPFLAEFRNAVDAVLPGKYAWFRDSSLHVTLRAVP